MTRSVTILSVAAITMGVFGLLPAGVAAQNGPPDTVPPVESGGLLQCQANLNTCTGDLSTCSGDLSTCTGNLTTCDGSLTSCNSDLSICDAALFDCQNTTCGNNQAEAGEQCDGTDLNGANCTTLGFDDGTLACDGTCAFDTSACSFVGLTCGNATLDSGEDCDFGTLAGQSCLSLGFNSGFLACGAGCIFDTGDCVECSKDALGHCSGNCGNSGGTCGCNSPLAATCFAGGGNCQRDSDCDEFEQDFCLCPVGVCACLPF